MTVPASGVGRIATGIKNVYAAELLSDILGGTPSYDTPFRLDGVSDGLDITWNDAIDVYFGDNQAAATANTRGDGDLTISRQSLDNDQEAFFLGNSQVNGFNEDNVADNPPEVAVMYEVSYNDGAAKFVQVDKARFSVPAVSLATKTASTTFQPDSLIGKAVARLADGRRKRSKVVAAASVAAERTAFFANANDAAVVALTLTPTPLDGATGVVVGDDIVLTYNNEMQVDTVNSSNVKLIKVSDGSEVALTWTADSAKKVFNGAHADLDAATDYLLVVTDNIRDVFGQGVEVIVNFTTA